MNKLEGVTLHLDEIGPLIVMPSQASKDQYLFAARWVDALRQSKRESFVAPFPGELPRANS